MWSLFKTKIKWSMENGCAVRKIFQIGYHARQWSLPFGFSYTGNINGLSYEISIYFFCVYLNWSKCTYTREVYP